jgi:hypothetical protein
MDGIAWDKIIGAAAQSTLGILSLGIILVGVLAYLFFGKSDDRVKLWVFAAILIAVILLGVAILRESRSAEKPGPEAGPSPTVAASASALPPLGPQQAAAGAAPAETPASIAGTWRDDPRDGFEFVVTTTGDRFTYTQTQSGVPAGRGEGTIAGRKLTYTFEAPDDAGRCSAQVDTAGTTMTGFCQDAARRWSVRFVRTDAR